MAKIVKTNESVEIKKSEAIVTARYKLSPLALKFISMVIASLKEEDDINEEYVFKVKDFQKLTGQKTKRIYDLVEEALEDLLKNPLTISLDDEKGTKIKANWVSGAVYDSGEVRFMIYPKLRPFLLEVKEKFLKYNLENILGLRSSYLIRLYELLKDWREMSERYGNDPEKTIGVKELREILEIPKSYQYSSHFKKLVLERAKKELPEFTDISFQYEEIKKGRKIEFLKFKIGYGTKDPMASVSSFKAYLQKYYVNRAIIEAPSRTDKSRNSVWSVNDEGKLYDMAGLETDIGNAREKEIFSNLYRFAIKNEDFKRAIKERKEWIAASDPLPRKQVT